MSDYLQPAPLRDRVLAACVDFAAPVGVWILLKKIGMPVLGLLLTMVYILLRDGAEGQSLGKRWRKIGVLNLDHELPATWKDSALRNMFLALPFLGFVIAGVEAYLGLRDRDRRRFGDRFAHTMVVTLTSLRVEEESA